LFLSSLAWSPIFVWLPFLLSWTCETWWSRFYGFLQVLMEIGNFLHHFNCHRHHCWNSCHVPHPIAPISWRDQKPINVDHWWHPYCHAHSFVYHHGHWFPSTLPIGSSFYSFKLCHTITYLPLSFHHVDACVWTRASRPYWFQNWCCSNDRDFFWLNARCYYIVHDYHWGDGWHGCALQWQDTNIYLEQAESW
jgi:hypothetical protein